MLWSPTDPGGAARGHIRLRHSESQPVYDQAVPVLPAVAVVRRRTVGHDRPCLRPRLVLACALPRHGPKYAFVELVLGQLMAVNFCLCRDLPLFLSEKLPG
jgi:hypothetical protein